MITAFLFFLPTISNIGSATHTTAGAKYWYEVCKNPAVDVVITEDCGGLISNHDPAGQGLSTEGWRVAKCVAGGALLIAGGYPELLSAGPAVGCGVTGNQKSNPSSNTNDPLGGLLDGLFGK